MAVRTTQAPSGPGPGRESEGQGNRTNGYLSQVVRGAVLFLGLGLALVLALLFIWSSPASGETWFVAPDGSGNYLNLTAALADTDHVEAGDIVRVAPGLYNDSVVVNRTLSIIGQGAPGEVIINGSGAGNTIRVTADSTVLANLTIRGGRLEWPYAAIHVHEAEGVELTHLDLNGSHVGLYLEGTTGAVVTDILSHGNQHGAWLLQANGTRLEGSRFKDNAQYGLVLQGSRDTDHREVISTDQVQDLRLSGANTHDTAWNCSFDTVVFVEGEGSLTRTNHLRLRVADYLGRPLKGVELNLTAGSTPIYRTPEYGGIQLVSDGEGTFTEWLLTYANLTAGASDTLGPLEVEMLTPDQWRPKRTLNLSHPLSLTFHQPDQPPLIEDLAPANNTQQRAGVELTWSGRGPEEPGVNFTLWYRVDDGVWQKNVTGNGTTFRLGGTAVGSNVSWKVEAHDGNLTSMSEVRNYIVNGPPPIELLGPENDLRLLVGPPVLNWTATDNDSAVLTYAVYYGEEGSPMVLAASGLDRPYYVLDRVDEGGNYTWKVEVDDGLGAVTSAVGRFSLNDPPTAHIEAMETLVLWPSNISLQGHGTDDGTVVAHQWRVQEMGVVANASSTILDNLTWGSHIIEYRVQDGEGLWSDWAQVIVKLYTPPEAEAGADTTGKVGQSVFFDASGSIDVDGEIVLYEWDFEGDGSFELAVQVPLITNTYHAKGPYQAVLRVTDNDGHMATDALVVTIEGGTTGTNGDTDDDDGFLPGFGALITLVVLTGLAILSIVRSRPR